MEGTLQSSTVAEQSLPPVYSIERPEMPAQNADSHSNHTVSLNMSTGRLVLSKGEPPPPYSDSVKVFHDELSFSDPPKYDEQQPSRTHSTTNVDRPLDINLPYVTSKQAGFKVVELIICLVGLSSCALFKQSNNGDIYSNLTAFLLFVMISSALFVVFDMWLNIISCFVHFPSKANYIKMAILHVITGIMLATASVLTICRIFNQTCEQSSVQEGCVLIWVSVVSGFLATVIFWLDAAIQVSNIINNKTLVV